MTGQNNREVECVQSRCRNSWR